MQTISMIAIQNNEMFQQCADNLREPDGCYSIKKFDAQMAKTEFRIYV